jgi:hypothetical protein
MGVYIVEREVIKINPMVIHSIGFIF